MYTFPVSSRLPSLHNVAQIRIVIMLTRIGTLIIKGRSTVPIFAIPFNSASSLLSPLAYRAEDRALPRCTLDHLHRLQNLVQVPDAHADRSRVALHVLGQFAHQHSDDRRYEQ